MNLRRTGFIIFVLFVVSLPKSRCYDDNEGTDMVKLFEESRPRVDAGVRRPYRICQGFEDPEEVDCYIRSDIKAYVCTEPASFNPCESKRRVTTYHYDHIRHRCESVNIPACSGQIIRAMTLIQCLIYCHNKDPYALGKSTSMVFKLNQPKPYVPKDEEYAEREKASEFVSNSIVKTPETYSEATKDNETPEMKAQTVKNDAKLANQFIKKLSEKVTTNDDGEDFNAKKSGDKIDESKNLAIKKENMKEKVKEKVLKDDEKSKATIKDSSSELDGKTLYKNAKKDERIKDVKKDALLKHKVKSLEKKEEKSKDVKKDALLKPEVKSLEKKEEMTKDVKKDALLKPEVKSLEMKEEKRKNVKKDALISSLKKIVKKEKKSSSKGLGTAETKKNFDEKYKKDVKKVHMIELLEKIVEREEMDKKSEVEKNDVDKYNTANINSKENTEHLENNDGQQKSAKKAAEELLNQLLLDDKKSRLENQYIGTKSSTETENDSSKNLLHDKKDLFKNIMMSEVTNKKRLESQEEEFKDAEDMLEKKEVKSSATKKIDTVVKSDSKDKSTDDGFYLWDE